MHAEAGEWAQQVEAAAWISTWTAINVNLENDRDLRFALICHTAFSLGRDFPLSITRGVRTYDLLSFQRILWTDGL